MQRQSTEMSSRASDRSRNSNKGLVLFPVSALWSQSTISPRQYVVDKSHFDTETFPRATHVAEIS